MDFTFTPEQIDLRQKARAFAQKEIVTIVHELDGTYDVPEEGMIDILPK